MNGDQENIEAVSADLVKIYSAHSNAEADLVKSLLEENGIPVYIRGYTHRSMLGWVGTYIDLDVMVPNSFSDQAEEVLAENLKEFEEEIQATETSSETKLLRPKSYMVAMLLPFIFPGLGSFYVGKKSRGKWILIGSVVCLITLFAFMPGQRRVLPGTMHGGYNITPGMFFAFLGLMLLDLICSVLDLRKRRSSS